MVPEIWPNVAGDEKVPDGRSKFGWLRMLNISWTPAVKPHAMIAERSVSRNAALATPQFYLLWTILFIITWMVK